MPRVPFLAEVSNYSNGTSQRFICFCPAGNFAQDFNAGHLAENATTDDGTDYLGLNLYDKGEGYIYRSAYVDL